VGRPGDIPGELLEMGWEVVDGLSTMEQVEKTPRSTDSLLSVSDQTPPDLPTE